MNRVELIGRLTRDPELKTTGAGASVVSVSLAVNRDYKNSAGEQQADFPAVVFWRQTAELVARSCSKGDLIGVTGQIQTRSYEDKSGKTIYVTEVVADHVDFCSAKKQGADQQRPMNATAAASEAVLSAVPDDDDLPF